MSKNCKPRNKTEKEREHDVREWEKTTLETAVMFSDFFTEYAELDGDIFFSSYTKAANQIADFERSKHIALAMPKVGDAWDYDKGIVGRSRYDGI